MVTEGSSLVIHISVKTTWGSLASPNLCLFYTKLGKNIWQAIVKPQQTKQLSPASQNMPKEERASAPTPTSALKPSPLTVFHGKVTWTYVNLREGPGMGFKIIGKAYSGNNFGILEEKSAWVRVRLESGIEGWMSKKAGSVPSSTSQTAAGSPRDSKKKEPSSKPPVPM